jgi:iron complex transport system substrate-binding protein
MAARSISCGPCVATGGGRRPTDRADADWSTGCNRSSGTLHPDLILDYGTVSPHCVQLDEAEQAKAGIPTVLFDGALPKTPQVLRALGIALHREDRAELLAREAEAILAAIPPQQGAAPCVVYGRGPDGLDLASVRTGAGQVFALLGWQVLAPEGDAIARHANIDAIRALDPDVIIFQNAGMRQTVANFPEWRCTTGGAGTPRLCRTRYAVWLVR